MISDYEIALSALMERESRLFVLTAENKGPCIEIGERFPDRFLDVGIAEQALVGIAAGLAATGSIPVVHAMAAFLTMRAFEFIRTNVGHQRHPVKIVGTAAGLLSEANGFTHQAIEDIALMRAIPGMKIFCPSDSEEMVEALPLLIDDDAPWYIRHNSTVSLRPRTPFKIGVAEVLGSGADVAIITCGLLLKEALAAADQLSRAAVAVRVINLRCLRPFDHAAVDDALSSCAQILTLEDHLETGGVFTLVSELAAGRGRMRVPIRRMALAQAFPPTLLPDVIQHSGLSAEHIIRAIESVYEPESANL